MTSEAVPAPAPRAGSARLIQLLSALALPVAIIGLWELAAAQRWIASGLIPPPSQTLRTWYVWAFGPPGIGLNPYSGTWFSTCLYSAERVAQGYAQAILIGVPLGILIGWSRTTERTIDPLIQMLRPIPITAWLPFSIALFGIRN